LQVYAEKYAEDQEAFFKDYAEAHAKLSNLGAKFDPPEVCQCSLMVIPLLIVVTLDRVRIFSNAFLILSF